MSTKKESWQRRLRRSLGSSFPKAIHRNRSLILGVTVVFIVLMGIAICANLIGDNVIDDAIREQTKPQRKRMEEVAQQIQTVPELTGFILRNNLWVVIQTVGLGIGFGIFPLYALTMNALTIGYTGAALNLPPMVVLSLLLPHGLIELSGIIIAIAIGFKLGIGSIRSVIRRKSEPLRKSGEEIAGLLPGAFLLLMIAGLIEGLFVPLHGPLLNCLKIALGLLLFLIALLWFSGKLTPQLTKRGAP